MPTRAEFAAAMKAKHPEYQGVPDEDLVTAILSKYPQFKGQIDDKPTQGDIADQGMRNRTSRAIADRAGYLVPPARQRSDDPKEDTPSMGQNILKGLTSIAAPAPNPKGNRFVELAKTVAPYTLVSSPGSEIAWPSLLHGGKRIISAGAQDAADGSLLTSPLRFARGMYRESQVGPSQIANRRPLADWVHDGYVDTAPAGEKSTPPTPQTGTPFHERPLYQQMEDLPDVGGAGTSRGGGPPMASTQTVPQIGQITGKAPSLEDVLTTAIDEIRAEGDKPGMVSSHPSTVETAGAGPLKQSGKFGKSGSLGQPGGFTSGRPPISPTRMDELTGRLGGRGSGAPGANSPSPVGAGATPAAETPAWLEHFRSTERPEEWHSGAEPGSPEAASAQASHKYQGEMDSLFKRKIDDPFASLLAAALLGGGSAGALMSSHGDEK